MRVLNNARSRLIVARFSGSFLQLGMMIALTRWSEPAVAAILLVQFSWVQILSSVAAWGHPLTVLRDVAANSVVGEVSRLRRPLLGVALVGLTVSVLTAFIPVGSWSMGVAITVGLAATLQASVRVVSQGLKALGHELQATLLEFALVPGALMVAAIIAEASGSSLTVATFAAVQATASAVALVWVGRIWVVRTGIRRAQVQTRGMITESTPGSPRRASGFHYLGLLQVLNIGTGHLPIVFAPHVLVPSDVALFAVAFRIASLVTTVLTAMNSYYGPRYARAIARHDRAEVARLLRSSQFIVGTLCLPLVIIIPWASELLALLGPEYFGAGHAYAILVTGQFVNAATGVVSYVLSLSHREKALLANNVTMLVVLATLWAIMRITDNSNLELYCIVYAVYISFRNGINLVIARATIRRIPQEQPS
jgi:O-antigen/teichoic acid export membrane protein